MIKVKVQLLQANGEKKKKHKKQLLRRKRTFHFTGIFLISFTLGQQLSTGSEPALQRIFGNIWAHFAAAAAKSLQPCPTLRDPIDSSPPGSAVPGILQERTLECVAIAFSAGYSLGCHNWYGG